MHFGDHRVYLFVHIVPISSYSTFTTMAHQVLFSGLPPDVTENDVKVGAAGGGGDDLTSGYSLRTTIIPAINDANHMFL